MDADVLPPSNVASAAVPLGVTSVAARPLDVTAMVYEQSLPEPSQKYVPSL